MTENTGESCTRVECRRHRFSFETAPMGIVWHDKEGKIIHVNQYASEKLGYSPAELAGNYLYKFVVLNTREEKDDYYDEIFSTFLEHHLFTKQGKVIPVRVVVYGAGPNEGDFGCAFFLDITENVRQAEMLRTMENNPRLRFSKPLDSEKDVVFKEQFRDFIGKSSAIGEVFRLICSVAPTPTTVLVTGETGTGKELVAQKIHDLSDREKGPLVKVNCATLPAHLIEGELFGHERGAFTGAHARKPGRFELADGGTIFLDEIGEMSPALQAKLLRVLQEGEFERLGGGTTLKADVRVVAATNRNLQELVKKGLFRSDLYFRLSIFPVALPPLRERKEDIPLLAQFFMQNFCNILNRKPKEISSKFHEKLLDYDWPGNVRELQNVVERASILSTDDTLDAANIFLSSMPVQDDATSSLPTFEENERQYIIRVLNLARGRVFGADGAAAMMQINPRTLTSKIKKLGIDKSSEISL